MKRFFAMAAAILMMGAVCSAQEKKASSEKRHSGWEAIKAEKIGFITDKLDLSVEEAPILWPVYNPYMNGLSGAERKVRHNLWALKAKKDETISDKEMNDRINDYVQSRIAADEVFARYCKEFLKVLPADKVGKLYLAEEQFNRNMVDKLVEKKADKRSKQIMDKMTGGAKPAPSRED
ncbi:MAG: hypothetical protein MJY57_05085 [Bacteroidales bacterium]|nr:hypothetical protein [Bacteroidales bacterium]